MKKKVIFTLAFLAVVFAFPVSAYQVETHAYLAGKTIEFFNEKSSQQIPLELVPYLIDGARREDDIPRWMNHFYDPVYNRGLTYDPKIEAGINFGAWEISKFWANDEENQNNATYKVPATIASILTAFQQRKLSAISDETNFTWNKALRLYIKGDKEKAMFALGHIIHLLQDTSVPDHTRNDPHADGSFYEDFSEKNLPIDEQLRNKSALQLGNLENYFNELAKYSNNNFYSADTVGIQSGFSLPEPIEFEKREEYTFGINRDSDGSYPLFKKKGNRISVIEERNKVIFDTDDIQIGYWNRLAPKAVQYSAGVVDLFFKEAERLKNDKEFLAKEDKSLFASLFDALRDAAAKSQQTVKEFFFGNQEQYQGITLADIEEFIAESQDSTSADEPIKEEVSGEILATSTSPTSTIPKESTSSEPVVLGTSTQKTATSTTTSTVLSLGEFTLRINEVMYDFLESDEKKEWVEVFHVGGDPVDLTRLSFFENQTKHRIEFAGGSSTISRNDFAVIAADPEEFLRINIGFSGNLFKSVMSLSNKGEELSLVADGKTYASMSYSSLSGANGNGMSLQYTNSREWLQSFPTPGRENVIFFGGGGGGGAGVQQTQQTQSPPPIDESTTTAAAVSHLLISEILFNVEGSDDGKEFIELYNPSSAPANLDGWALRYKTDNSTTTVSIISFNVGNGDQTVIPGNGFLLVGLSNYDSANYNGRIADATRSRSLPNGSSRVRVTLYDAEDTFVDEIFYDESSITSDGQSIERRAIQENVCYVPQRLFEYLGNGCDSGANWDFVIRAAPLPQNSRNLVEPRARLAAPVPENGKTNIAEYVPTSIGISFSWQPVTPNTAGGRVWYRISEFKNGVLGLLFKIDATSSSIGIKEVGRNYDFEITAEDGEGYTSEPGRYSLTVPSFLESMSVYADPREGRIGKYIADLYYNAFPFFPSGRNAWQGFVLYRSRDPNQSNTELNTSNELRVTEGDGVVEVIYPRCYGGPSERREQALIFPLSADWCYLGGGLHSSALDRSELEDNHLLVTLADNVESLALSVSDYFTLGFYDFSDSGAGRQILSLAAVDMTRHPFVLHPPENQSPPILDGDFSVDFDPRTSTIGFSLPRAYDPDTLDGNITWESNCSPPGDDLDPSLWDAGCGGTVAPGDAFLIGVRARDDFGNYSSVMTTSWEYPTTMTFISQDLEGGWSNVFGTVVHNYLMEPDTASFQSFSPEENFSFDFVILKFIQELLSGQQQPSDPANLRLSVFSAKEDGSLDNASLLGVTFLNLYNPNPAQEQTFSFDAPISVEKDKTYWLALDISYGPGHFRNVWKNALAGGNPYLRGQAGSGFGNGSNPGTDMFSVMEVGDIDWYFKIGRKLDF